MKAFCSEYVYACIGIRIRQRRWLSVIIMLQHARTQPFALERSRAVSAASELLLNVEPCRWRRMPCSQHPCLPCQNPCRWAWKICRWMQMRCRWKRTPSQQTASLPCETTCGLPPLAPLARRSVILLSNHFVIHQQGRKAHTHVGQHRAQQKERGRSRERTLLLLQREVVSPWVLVRISLGAPSMASSAALMPSLAGSCAFLSPAGASVGAAGAAAPPSSSCSPASTSILSLLLSGFICSHHTCNE